MHGRTPVAVMVAAFSALALVSAAPASALTVATVDQAAASVDFPVFEITRAASLRVRTFTVRYDAGEEENCMPGSKPVLFDYRRQHSPSQRWIQLGQSAKPCRPASAPGHKVRRIRVLGRRVTIRRYCAGARLDCQLHPRADGVYAAQFWLRSGDQRTQLSVQAAARVGLRGVVRALRSLRLVDLPRPVVALDQFRSPDGRIFCMMYDDDEHGARYVVCATGDPAGSDPRRSASLSTDGTVGLCDQDPLGCFPNWDAAVPLLAAGQTTRFGRFTCTEQVGAVTCAVADGEHAGKGFRIDVAGVEAISP